MMRVLVLGANGLVGSALMDGVPASFETVGLGHGELEIASEEETLRAIQDIRPQMVIHAAAYTDVDGCEVDPERAFKVNGRGTQHVAMACRRIGARLVYISTDYVFDGAGSRPYTEDDPVNPLSIYGKSKLDGERHIQRLLRDAIIVRTQWLYGNGGKNFVSMVLGWAQEGRPLTIVGDQIGSPTDAVDLSRTIYRLLEKGLQGVFHVANSSSCSWVEFAQEILKIVEMPGIEIIPVSGASLGRPAPRPRYSVLDCQKLVKEAGVTMRPWQEALREFLEKRRAS